MTAYLLLLGGVTGIALCLGVSVWVSERRDRALRRELRETQDRLYGAWQAGAQIPPRIEEVIPETPLPEELRPLVDQWSSPDVRAGQEDRIRRMLARKQTPSEIARTLTVEQASRAL